MSVRSVSDKTFWAGMAYARLGQEQHARELFQKIYDYSLELEQQKRQDRLLCHVASGHAAV